MAGEHDDRTKDRADVLDELRRELERSAPRARDEELSRITDLFLVRHPGRAGEIHRELDRVCATSGISEPPTLARAIADVDTLRTVVGDRGPGVGPTPGPEVGAAGMPARIGRCRVIRELGRGGMGAVLLGHDPVLRRRVAIKVLPREFAADAVLVERFRREAAAVAELEHPAIVPIYEIGEEDGIHYYVMRYIEGASLRDWCRERMARSPLGEDSAVRRGARALLRTTARQGNRASFSIAGLGDVLRVFEDLARGLHHAHERGIVHRDVKPANVMVDAQGYAQLLDFGLARFERAATMTQSGLLLGTVAYMAPEQIASSHGRVDARSDVFALGVSLFECLTGVRPFGGDTVEATLQEILDREPPSPLVFVPELSRDIETIVLKCLEKRPQRRYPSALALAEDLARVRAHERIEAQAIGRLGRALRWAERHRAAATAALMAVLAVLALLAVATGTLLVERARQAEAAERLAGRLDTALAALETTIAGAADRAGRRAALDEPELQDLALRLRALAGDDRERIAAALRRGAARVERLLGGFELRGEGDAATPLLALLALLDLGADLRGRGRLDLVVDPPGAEVLIRDDSGREVWRGSAPITDLELPCGSYGAEVAAPDRIAAVYPFLVARGSRWGAPTFAGGAFAERDWTLRLPPAGSFAPERFALVPAGPYLATRDPDWFGRDPELEWRWLDDFVIAREETRAADWQEFLADETIRAEIEFRPEQQRLVYLPRVRPDRPSEHFLDANATPEEIQKGRLRIKDEAREFAIGGVSFSDAARYLDWLAEAKGLRRDLPSRAEWEKAARGVDGRLFPWGDDFDWSAMRGPDPATMLGRLPGPPGEEPRDRSPYGLLDLAGNVREWCRDGGELGDGEINPYLAGGDCSSAGGAPGWFMTWPRSFLPRDNVAITWGLRLVLGGARR